LVLLPRYTELIVCWSNDLSEALNNKKRQVINTAYTIVYTWSEEKNYKLASNLHRIKYKLQPEKYVGKLLANLLGAHTCTFTLKAAGTTYRQGPEH